MGLFDLFRKPPIEPSTSRRKVRDEPGPLTAHQAWALVEPAARALDPQARLLLLTSGLDLSHEGRSYTWEFEFDLPQVKGHALLSLEPSEEGNEIEEDPLVLIQRVGPRLDDGSGRPALPEPFRDSPDVVAEFTARGVDFVAGPTDMKLEGRVLPTGEAVWMTYGWDGALTAAFVKRDT